MHEGKLPAPQALTDTDAGARRAGVQRKAQNATDLRAVAFCFSARSRKKTAPKGGFFVQRGDA
jgi:hypothetical protein